jgi:hypothetical protein
MPTRLVREGINDSKRVNALSMGAELFYRKLMSLVDDFGRFEADAAILRGKLFFLRPDVSVEDVQSYLEECSQGEDPLVLLYSVGRKVFLQINNFGQRERTSKYPAPGDPADAADRRHLRAVARSRASSPTPTPTPSPNTTPTSNTTPKEESARETSDAKEFDEVFDRVARRYPGAGATRLAKARERFAEANGGDREVPAEDAEGILAGLERWKVSESWVAGKIHWIGNFFAERLWEEHPLPAGQARAAANGTRGAQKQSRAEARKALLETVTLENKQHAHN